MAGLVARVRFEQPAGEMGGGGAVQGSSRTQRDRSGTRWSRIIAPKPSMMAMVVSVRTSGSRTPSRSRSTACAAFG